MRTKTVLLFAIALLSTMGLSAQKSINIFGVVRDNVKLKPVQGANVTFMDENSLPIYNGKTNEEGYFIIETKLAPGRKILIKISKEGLAAYSEDYYIKDRENYLEVFLEPGISDQKIGVTIQNKRGKKIPGAQIDFEVNNRRMEGGETDENGYLLIQHKFVPGQSIVVFVKKDKYIAREITHTYSKTEGGNSLTVVLKKDTKLKPGYKVAIAGGGLLLIAGAAKLVSNKQYNNYLDGPANFSGFEERESIYKSANTLNKTAAVTFDTGALAAAGGLAWVWFFTKNEEQQQPKSTPTKNINFFSGIGYDPASNSVVGGIRVTF